MAGGKAKNLIISHCPRGQGGRTVGGIAQRAKGKRNVSSEKRGLRQKVAIQPKGPKRLKHGIKYTPIDVKLAADGTVIGDWTPTKEYL